MGKNVNNDHTHLRPPCAYFRILFTHVLCLAAMDEKISSFLSNYPELEHRDERGGVVKCSLSGHEMPCHLEVLQSYVGGRKFAKLRAEMDYKSLEPFIISSAYRKHQLFCTLTNCHMNRKPAEVKGHIAGRKYTRALERYNAGEVTLFKERKRKKSVVRTLGHVRENSPEGLPDDITDIRDHSPLSVDVPKQSDPSHNEDVTNQSDPSHDEDGGEEDKMEDSIIEDTTIEEGRRANGDKDEVTSCKRKQQDKGARGKKRLKLITRAVTLKSHKKLTVV